MVQRLVERLRSVARRGVARFRAKRAVRAGLFRGIEFEKLRAIRQGYDAHPFRKYHDKFQHSLVRNAERIFTLGLDRTKGLRILDLGCGFGYFMYAARQFGHHPIGLDQDDPYFNQVTGLLGLRKVLHTITPFEPLPDIPEGSFDLITAFATCFDRAGVEGQWGPKEWEFFLTDLARFMAPGCLLHIKFNQYVGTARPRSFECRPVPDDLMDYFRSMDARFDKRAMQIPNALLHVAAR